MIMRKIFIAITLISSLIACTDSSKEGKDQYIEKTISSDNTSKTSCPYLTSDDKGNIVLSWVKELNDSMAVMCYAVSEDKGKTFGESIEISSSNDIHPHGENLPKIIFKPKGEIIAMWGVNNSNPKSKYSGLVYYAQSFDNGKTWTEKIPLVKDTSAYDQRYFDMELLPNGEAMVLWLDNRGKKEKEGSDLYFASTNGKDGFQNEKRISESCCQCCRTDLFIDDKGNVHASYRDIINDSIRDMVQMVSADGGKTFSPPVRISADNWVINGCPHTGPTVTQNKTGMHFAWYTMGGGEGVFYCNSKDLGKTFSKRNSVSSDPSAKHPQITTLSNGNIVIVWDQRIKIGELYNSHIGLQERDPEGKIILTKFISSVNTLSDFAVIKLVDETTVLVAYDQRDKKKENVTYKIISLQN